MNAIDFAITTENALAMFTVGRKAGIVTGTCWSGVGRLANAAGVLFLAEKAGKPTDAAVKRLEEAAAFVAAMLPLWGALGVEVDSIGKQIFEQVGQPRAPRAGTDLDTAKTEALAKVLQAGGAAAVAMANARASAEDETLAAAKEHIRAVAAQAVSRAGSGSGSVPWAVIAAEFERMWEATQRQTAWVVESLQRTRLPSRVAQLGAEATEYALLAAEFEKLATAAYEAVDTEAAAAGDTAAAAVSAAVFDLG